MPASIDAVPLTHSNELTINRMGDLPDAVPGVSVPLQVLMERRIDFADFASDPNWVEIHDPPESWTFFTEPASVERVDDLHEFTRKVSRLDGVAAILAEEGESGERHITTFIETESEQLVEQIIDAQADIIDLYCQESGSGAPSSLPRQYSFHIRVVPKNEEGKFALPRGHYCLLPWTP